MDDILKELNDKVNNEEEMKKFCDDFEKQNEIKPENMIKGPNESIKDKYLNNVINKPNLDDIKDNKDEIQEATLEVKPVDAINKDSITEYCQYKDCYKKSSKKAKYKFMCKDHQKDGQKLLNSTDPHHNYISEDIAAKSLLAFHQQLYAISEFMGKMFINGKLDGLTQKAIDNREDLLQIHKDIIKTYGVESVDIIANPLATLILTSGSHILMTYMENNNKETNNNLS